MEYVISLVPDINAGGQVDKYSDTGAAGKGAFEDALAAFETVSAFACTNQCGRAAAWLLYIMLV